VEEEFGPGEELDPQHLEELKQRIESSPFHRWAGMKLVEVGRGHAHVEMLLEEHHFNPQGIVHGGIIAAVADTAIGLALRSVLPPGHTHRTAQLNVHFLSKGEGGRLVGQGKAFHRGRRMGYGEGEVRDESGALLARATATFIVLPAPGAF
jgi:acyl-CoA thioesterase